MPTIKVSEVTAQELHDAARASYVFESGTRIACTRLGDNFHLFDLDDDGANEVKLDCANTSPERLLAHFKGYVENRRAA